MRACDCDLAKTARKHDAFKALAATLGRPLVALPLVEQGRVIDGIESFVKGLSTAGGATG